MSKANINIVNYSEKSFVLCGEATRPFKEEIKEMGAKWNSSLNDPETGEKFMGWIFPNVKRQEVEKWLNRGGAPKPVASTSSSSGGSDRAMMAEIRKLHAKIDALTALVQNLAAGGENDTDFLSASEDEEETPVPLMRKGKNKA